MSDHNRSHTRDADPCCCPLCSSPFLTSPARERRPEDGCRAPVARDAFHIAHQPQPRPKGGV